MIRTFSYRPFVCRNPNPEPSLLLLPLVVVIPVGTKALPNQFETNRGKVILSGYSIVIPLGGGGFAIVG